jgi:hypothetical protein
MTQRQPTRQDERVIEAAAADQPMERRAAASVLADIAAKLTGMFFGSAQSSAGPQARDSDRPARGPITLFPF